MTFKSWLKKKYWDKRKKKWQDTSDGDFAYDVHRDRNWRVFKTKRELLDFMRFYKACKEAKKTASACWDDWKAETTDWKRIDGLGVVDIEKIKKALRKVWAWSYARKLVIARCTQVDGFVHCEKCKIRTPKIFVDHIVPVGIFNKEYIERLFVPSKELQGLCKKCHASKTKKDIAQMREDQYDLDF